MLICNGMVFGPGAEFVRGCVRINGDIFEEISSGDMTPLDHEPVVDAGGGWVIPGLIDIHLHGCRGYDFGDATEEALRGITAYQLRHGVTTICATTMTMSKEQILRTLRAVDKFCSADRQEGNPPGAEIAGINLEGPFISPERKGSQEESHIKKPDTALLEQFQRASGNRIRLLDLAPEMDGAMELIRRASREMTVSIAHSSADYETAMRAFRSGARHVTHLYNAMSPYEHRAPGIVGAAGDTCGCTVELIADGLHVHPSVVRNTFRMFGAERIVLVSDSMRATGMEDGIYELGGHTVYVKGGRALLSDGTIAASVTNLFACMKKCVQEMGIPLSDAVRCASVNPAKAAGIDSQVGSISEGKQADMVILDKVSLDIRMVIQKGRIVQR